ncbi:MAG: DUF6152 family protein [Gammaproteobacteria bacterium]|nr:hypothetical protein [Pseudomonadales bacterium]MCP5348040.1 hypothetical protein [Pseudomonadales bacterium]
MRGLIAVIAMFLIGSSVVYAHHGLESYDTGQLIEFEGKVVGFRLMDPHSILVVEVEASDGAKVVWEVEGGRAAGIVEAGLTREFLGSGPLVRVTGYQSKDALCAPNCRMAGQDFDFER